MGLPLANRDEAGALLAERLMQYAKRDDVVVLALPRGGVPVGYAIAEKLDVPLDVIIVRKLGVPGQEELAMGAVGGGGLPVLHREGIQLAHINPTTIDAVAGRELRELARREAAYRGDRPRLPLADWIVILVDDGLATGSTMRVAIQAASRERPQRIVVAAPVAAPETCAALANEADEVICLYMPDPLYALGLWDADFSPTTDAEVKHTLRDAARRRPLRQSVAPAP